MFLRLNFYVNKSVCINDQVGENVRNMTNGVTFVSHRVTQVIIIIIIDDDNVQEVIVCCPRLLECVFIWAHTGEYRMFVVGIECRFISKKCSVVICYFVLICVVLCIVCV